MRRRKLMRVKLKIREVAQAKGITMAKLSRRADLGYNTVVSAWNNPDRDITVSTLVKLAAALKVEVTDLFEVIPDEEEQ